MNLRSSALVMVPIAAGILRQSDKDRTPVKHFATIFTAAAALAIAAPATAAPVSAPPPAEAKALIVFPLTLRVSVPPTRVIRTGWFGTLILTTDCFDAAPA